MSYLSIKHKSLSDSGKTNIYEVLSLDEIVMLGTIKWRGAWRKYVFFPEPDTLYDSKCLIEIAEFCEKSSKEQLKK